MTESSPRQSGSVHIINHTHWDREWFLTEEYTTEWIPELIDAIDELHKANPNYQFLFDGQTPALEDLLRTRPDYEALIGRLVSAGVLGIGPLYSQPDCEWRAVNCWYETQGPASPMSLASEGRLGQPSVVYENPSNEFVGGFIGNPPMNFVDGTVRQSQDQLAVELAGQKLTVGSPVPALGAFDGKAIRLGIRAENMETVQSPVSDGLKVRVEVVEPLGAQNLLTVTLLSDGSTAQPMKVSTHPTFGVAAGEELWVRFPSRQIRWIDPETREMLSSE